MILFKINQILMKFLMNKLINKINSLKDKYSINLHNKKDLIKIITKDLIKINTKDLIKINTKNLIKINTKDLIKIKTKDLINIKILKNLIKIKLTNDLYIFLIN